MEDEYLCDFGAKPHTVADDVSTYPKLFLKQTLQWPNRRCFGTREFLVYTDKDGKPEYSRGDFEWYSYPEIFRMIVELYHGLVALGIKRGDRIGLLSQNRTEWSVLDIACGSLGAVLVPIYDTQSNDEVLFVCKDSGVTALFIALDRLPKWSQSLAQGSLPDVKTVVALDDRLDDRCFLARHWAMREDPTPLPDKVPLVQRPFEFYDNIDSITNVMMPRPLTVEEKKSPLKTKMRYSSIVKSEPVSPGFFSYLPNKDLPHELDKAADDQKLKAYMNLFTHTFHQVLALGRASDAFRNVVYEKHYQNSVPVTDTPMYDRDTTKPSDLMTLVYTSGTTGTPKGAMLTQANVIWTTTSMESTRVANPTPFQDYMLSYLPNAHIYQRVLQGVCWLCGGATGFWQGNIRVLISDVQTLRPTIFVVVPRVLQKLFDGIMTKVDALPKFKRFLFFSAYAARRKAMLNGKPFPRITNLIFGATKSLVGGRLRQTVSGSAPLSNKMGEFIRIVCDTQLFEGWGMTETSAQGTVQPITTKHWGGIGESLDAQTKIKLISVPDMDYHVTDRPNPRGEIWIKSPSIFQGYYNDEAKTKEVLSADGWFMTGDIGVYQQEFNELQIIDRKRCIFKLSQGEYVSNRNVEDKMGHSKLVEQCFMYADRYESYVLGVVVPNFAAVRKELNVEGTDAELSYNVNVIAGVAADIEKVCRAGHLRSFEIPRAIILDYELWTPENHLLTPAMKLKRPAITAKYEPILRTLYAALNSHGEKKQTAEEVAKIVITVSESGPTMPDGDTTSGFTGVSAV